MVFRKKILKKPEKLKRALTSARWKARRRVITKYLKKRYFRKKGEK